MNCSRSAPATASGVTEPARVWALANGRSLGLARAQIMAIVNATPDSFSDGGRYRDASHAATEACEMLAQGADMLDVGGESTRPGASPVAPDEQVRRVVPVIEALRARGVDAPISVDTSSALVAHAALDAGADAVNDQSAARDDPGMLPLVASRGAGLVLMHRLRPTTADSYSDRYGERGEASRPEYDARSGGVVGTVESFLRERVERALEAGVERGALVVDPGVGFGKTVEQSVALVGATSRLVGIGPPVLCAVSRKSFLGKLLGEDDPLRRDDGSAAIAVAMRLSGATIFRVHDIAGHRRALTIADAIVASRGRPRGPGEVR